MIWSKHKSAKKQLRKVLAQKSVSRLKTFYEEIGLKGYHSKSKDDLIELLLTEPKEPTLLLKGNWWNES